MNTAAIDEEALHQKRIQESLAQMERNPEQILRYEVIGRGLSGAYVYRLHLAGEELILKITELQRERYVIERARREMAFYRELAPRIPLHVPGVVAMHEGSRSLSLLLVAYQPAPALQAWSVNHWIEVVAQLARLHATFWHDTQSLSCFPWLNHTGDDTTSDLLSAASGHWDRLRTQPSFSEVLPERECRWILGMLSRIDELDRMVRRLPPTLCHGDCNSGNLLRDANGRWIWADWQEVGLGRGPEDLSIFLQLAAFDGTTIPREEVIVAYHQRLEEERDERIPLTLVRRVMDAAELRTRLLHWPAYLMQASPRQITEMVGRIHQVAEELGVQP
jgi:hypothetical protein